MDDLIVIILTLIVAGVGVLGQLKKKKKAQSNSGVNKNAPDSFWDLIQGESNFIEQEEVSEFEESESDSETGFGVQSEVKKQDSVYRFEGKKERRSRIADGYGMPTKKLKIKSELVKDFTLRKAVIYSEILNRKYT